MEYTVKKSIFEKKGVNFLYVFFENGDYISLDGSELVAISVDVYDKLARHSDGFSAVAESGYIELKISERDPENYHGCFVFDPILYDDCRKQYIEFLCLEENYITQIWFFDKLNRHRELIGNFKAEKNGDILRLTVFPHPQLRDASSDKHTIMLGDIFKGDICCIDFDFENCESFMIFDREIKEIGLELDKKLTSDCSRFHRRVKSGYIILKLKKSCYRREHHLFNDKHLKRKVLERRLCGKKGFATHDICHINIYYHHAAFDDTLSECIEIDDMRPSKEVARLIKKEEEDNGFVYCFESGYSKRLKDRTIILTFGNNAKKLMKELCKHND